MVKKTETSKTKTELDAASRSTEKSIQTKTQQKQKHQSYTKRPMSVFLRVGLSVIVLLLIAFIFTWYMINEQFARDPQEVNDFLQDHTLVFLYNYLLIFCLTAILAALLWRPFLASGIMFSIISIFMYINTQKYHYRAMPLLPEDFQMVEQAGDLTEFVEPWGIVRLVCGVIFILVGTWLIDHFAKRAFGKSKAGIPWWERWAIIPRCSFVAIALVAFTLMSEFLLHHNTEEHGNVTWLDTVFEDWNPPANYKKNGFLMAFLYNAGMAELVAPAEYSETKVAQIAQELEEKKQTAEENLPPLSEVVDNIILVLDESFYDPSILHEPYEHSGGDVTPNLHKIFQKYPSGYMYSPEYGGSTANVEFAAMTGLSNYWLNDFPYTNFATKISTLPGVASYAKENGFDTTAIHGYDGNMYKRNTVYNRMGFDEFRDEGKMIHTDRENEVGYISDRSMYNEALDILEQNKDKQMLGIITMQNHGPYDSAKYPDRQFMLNDELHGWYNVVSSYESLHHADQYLGEFIAELDRLNEKTVMIWFGDHAAGVLGQYVDSEDQDLVNLAHLTPYFVYANFELDNDYSVKEVAEINTKSGFQFDTVGVNLPTVTPNCLPNILYNLLDVQKPELMYLLDTVCEETPILAPVYFNGELPAESKALKEYEIINYDFSNGNNYWLKQNQ